MKILELFAGSRSIGKEAEKLGYYVFSVDIEPFDGIDLVKDIGLLKYSDIPFIPDMIWASPPCTTYSIAAISHHRPINAKISHTAFVHDQVNRHFLNMIRYFVERVNPNMKYYIENPRGYMRKMEFMVGIPRTTVTYCSYGDTRMKPTDIWSNNLYNPIFNPTGWNPRPMCHNGNKKCHHEPAPRGSKTGTQGLKGNYERSIIPSELCKEVLMAL